MLLSVIRSSPLFFSFCLALAPSLLTGCGTGTQGKLRGKWVGVAIDNVPPAQLAKATGWVKGTSLTFQGAKITVAVPGEEPRTGEYQIINETGSKLTLRFLRSNGEVDEARFVLADEKTLRWDIGNERAVTLERATKE